MNVKKTLEALPGIKSQGLKGSGIYSDAVIDDAKLGLECIYDALENPTVQALNYHQITSQQVQKDGTYIINVEDLFTKKKKAFQCKQLVFATGPFTDQVLKQLDVPWEPKMLLSKGSHLWLKEDALQVKDPMVLQTKDLRIIFVIPQRHAILVGTTEVALEGNEDIFNIQASQEEIQYLLDNINEYFPTAGLTQEHILSTFAGVRPLVKDGKSSRGKTSRKHVTSEPVKNMHVIIGGKYTTFRVMAADITKKIVRRLGLKYDKKLSLKPLRKKSLVANIHTSSLDAKLLHQIVDTELAKTKEDILVRRLSAPSLSHCPIPDKVDSLLNEVESELVSVREPHNNSRA